MPSTYFHKQDTANWFYVTIHMIKHIEANALSDKRNIFQEKLKKIISYMFSRINSVCSIMFVEKSSRHPEIHEKVLKTRKSSRYHFLEFFRTRVLDTH